MKLISKHYVSSIEYYITLRENARLWRWKRLSRHEAVDTPYHHLDVMPTPATRSNITILVPAITLTSRLAKSLLYENAQSLSCQHQPRNNETEWEGNDIQRARRSCRRHDRERPRVRASITLSLTISLPDGRGDDAISWEIKAPGVGARTLEKHH